MPQIFSPRRKVPKAVLLVRFNDEHKSASDFFNMVEVGGSRELREDFFDNARNVCARHPAHGGCQVFSVYDVALCGGEPFSLWH